MKYVAEYRDARLVQVALDEIRRTVKRPWVLMEICGGQTHAIVRHGLDQLLPSEIELVHGPGCPVCVTALATIDQALAIVAPEDAEKVLQSIRAARYGGEAVIVGEVRADPKGRVLAKTRLGSTRLVDMLPGEMLPRIC